MLRRMPSQQAWKVAFSSSVSGSSTTSSTPLAPMTHGTPAKRPALPYSPEPPTHPESIA